jgi:hypothetical protein
MVTLAVVQLAKFPAPLFRRVCCLLLVVRVADDAKKLQNTKRPGGLRHLAGA